MKNKFSKVPFKKVLQRLTGFSTPVFGISWEPPKLECEIVQRFFIFLDDRRVLSEPNKSEVPRYAIQSVIEIRERLNQELDTVDISSPLAQSLLSMRTACRKFLDNTQRISEDRDFFRDVKGSNDPSKLISFYHDAHLFYHSLGRLRTVFGIHVAHLSVRYGIDVPGKLAYCLPDVEDEENAIA